MARITVEDCLEHLPNRFSLVLVSAKRTKQLLRGADPMLEDDSENKEVVTSLREIAAGKFSVVASDIQPRDEWLPYSRRSTPAPVEMEDELPPEA